MVTWPPLGKAGGVAFGAGAAGMNLPPAGPDAMPRVMVFVKNKSREPSMPTARTVIGFLGTPAMATGFMFWSRSCTLTPVGLLMIWPERVSVGWLAATNMTNLTPRLVRTKAAGWGVRPRLEMPTL